MNDPRIYLAMSNCFASKRWTASEDWIRIIRKWGITNIEASTDVECDPLYCGHEGLRRWAMEAESKARKAGVQISSLHTGHGAYGWQGLTSKDQGVRRRIQEDWIKPLINTASNLKAGLGFFGHAIPQKILYDPAAYKETYKRLIDELGYLSLYARDQNLPSLAMEYADNPCQPPWTIDGTRKILAEVFAVHKAPFYTIIDTANTGPQKRYPRPMVRHLASAIRAVQDDEPVGKIWLGTKAAYDMVEDIVRDGGSMPEMIREVRGQVQREIDTHPWLFAKEEDADIYKWIEELVPYSPVIHLHQTDGKTARQLPFTSVNNLTGFIEPRRVLNAIAKGFNQAPSKNMPPFCKKVYITIRVFPDTYRRPREILDALKESVKYWRKFIPEDGIPISQISIPEEPMERIRHPGWMLPGTQKELRDD